jgi:maltose-binding protein MalE
VIATAARRAAVAALILVTAACGGRTEDDETVVLWHAYQGDERAALEATIDDFNARSHGTRIKPVSVAYDAFADKISNAIPNGNGPDLFIFAHDRLGDWVAGGLVEPVEYYVDEEMADRYAYDALAAMAYDGSLYGLPLAVKSVALFYRTDLVDAPPTDTDELYAWARDHRGTYALVYQNTDLYGHAAWLHGFGGSVLDDDDRPALAATDSVRAARFARALVDAGVSPRETNAPMVATLFNEGKAAMAISGPWFIADIASDVPWGVTILPVVSETGRRAAPFLGAEGVLMSARARDKDRAFAAMSALVADRAAIARARGAKQVVPNLAAYREPDIGADKVLSAFRAQLEHTVPMPATPAMRMVWTPYKTALQAIVARGADPESSLGGAAGEIATYIDGANGR